ncbi:CASP C terminal-domain-containing protein [Haematococcus lacustris]
MLARLEALQQLVDGQMEVEGWSVEGRQDALRSLGQSPGQVTSVLQERVRKLTSQLASLQRELQETRDALAGRSAQLAAAQAAEAQQAGLVRQLEEDLAACKVPCFTAAGPDSALDPCERTLPTGLDPPHDPMSPRGGPGAPAAAPLGGPEGCGGQGGGEGALLLCSPSGPRVQDAGSLLDIVVHQRDRFRQRMAQLEEEKSTLADSLQRTQRQLEEARADSVSLYEKIRYLERFTQQQAAGTRGTGAASKLTVLKVDAAGIALNDQVAKHSAHRYQCGPLAFEIGGGPPGVPEEQQQGQPGPGGGGGQVRARGGRPGRGPPAAFCFPADPEAAPADPETRAAKAYEAKVNPFNDFQKGEVESRVRSMQLHDRAVLAGSRLLLASRLGRAFAAVYALLLHLFIMVLLYYAMLPRTRIEMVDIGALQQQQQAGAAATPGRMLRLL